MTHIVTSTPIVAQPDLLDEKVLQTITKASSIFKVISIDDCLIILKEVYKAIQGNPNKAECYNICQSSPEKSLLFSILFNLLKTIIRLPDDKKIDQKSLELTFQRTKIPNELSNTLIQLITNKSRFSKLQLTALKQRPRFPSLSSTSWRIDIVICSSVINRILEPAIILKLTLSDGSVISFSLSVASFHKLRYDVTAVLKSMTDLEKRFE